MKAIVIFNSCVALLLTIVSAESITEDLNKIAMNGEIIDGIFKPSKNGLLGSGRFGTLYKGQFLPCNNMEIAMKFMPLKKLPSAQREYRMYTYLHAINNPNVEAYGILTVYYYGRWFNHILMGMTLLSSEFQTQITSGNIKQLDLMIAMREFVRIIKYIHSKGIVHYDINTPNIMIKNDQSFIFDFGISLDMKGRPLAKNIADAKVDFQIFLYSLFKLIEPRSNWHWLGFGVDDEFRMKDKFIFAKKLAEDANLNDGNQFSGLRRIFVEFAKHALDKQSAGITDTNGTQIPFYDQLYRVIREQMNETASVSSISTIPDPFGDETEWDRRPIDYELFEKMYADRIKAAREKIKEANEVLEKVEPSNKSGWWFIRFWDSYSKQ